jgi:hypothetical protein
MKLSLLLLLCANSVSLVTGIRVITKVLSDATNEPPPDSRKPEGYPYVSVTNGETIPLYRLCHVNLMYPFCTLCVIFTVYERDQEWKIQ